MKITVNDIMSKEPCDDYPESEVEKLWGDNEYLSLCQICDLDVPVDDRTWAATQFLPDRENRLFASDCAESVLHLWTAQYPDDNRPVLAIKAARDFANGKIDDASRAAAWAASRAAALNTAWAASRAAAWAASRAASRDTYRAAAWTTARYASRAASRAAAWAAEKEKQIKLLRGYCEELDK